MGKRKSNVSQTETVSTKRSKSIKNESPEDSDNDDEVASTSEHQATASQVAWSQQPSTQVRLQRSGKVLSVRLKNFMCHRHLNVEFNRHTNLVVGANGSGKSAILTALIIGLGSKANATNRSTSIKQFIKTGEAAATIEVHLANDGGDSYEPELYGDRIIVIRHITSAGTSTYKIQNANGRTISTSRSDLMKMTLYMNIQVDNPICVMTQDATRSFLRDSNPKMQYQLFMKATQLDVITQRLDECILIIRSSKVKLQSHMQSHAALQKQQDAIDCKVKQFQSMEPLREEIRQCKNAAGWRRVIDQESLLSDINTTYDESNQDKTKMEQELNKWSNMEQMLGELHELDNKIKTNSKAFSEEERQLIADKTAWKQQNEAVLEQQREVKKIDIRRTKLQNTIQKLEETIRNELSTDKDRLEQIQQENLAKLTALNQKRTDLEATIKTHSHEKEVFEDASAKYQQQFEAIQAQRDKISNDKRNLEQTLKNIQGSSEARLRHYGSYMPNLIHDVESSFKKGNLTKMPVGPLANHIEITMPEYRHCIEDLVGTLALAFCVNNDADGNVLRGIMRKHGATKLPVITTKFTDRVYNIDSTSVARDQHAVRALDTIRVDNSVVMNCLIDMCGIETILVTKNTEHAKNITSRRENVPKSLSRVIVTKPYAEYYPAPLYRSYSKKLRPSRYLRVSETDRQNVSKAELSAMSIRMEELSIQSNNIRKGVSENQKHIDERTKTIIHAEKILRNCELEIQKIKDVEYNEEGIDTTVMAQEIEEQSQLLKKETDRYEEAQAKYADLKSSISAGNSNIAGMKKKMRELEEEIHNDQKSKDDILQKTRKCDSMVEHYGKKIRKISTMLDALAKERADALEKLNRLEATAMKSGLRVDNAQTEEELQAIIRRNERKISAVASSTDTLEDLLKQQKDAVSSVEKSGALLNVLKKALQVLRNSIETRFHCVRLLKNSMKTRISYNFVRMMELRKCDANLEFDDAASSLKMEVTPRDKKGDKTVSKLTNLSGGERSYVTVAFLLALWACVDHPFYFLDEYDVFTDEINRSYMTKLLLREAKQKPNYQYTFLTPQDISDITASSDISILRLDKPTR